MEYVDDLAIAGDVLARARELSARRGERRARRSKLALRPKLSMNPRQELGDAKGLCDVVVCSSLEALDLILLGVLGSDHDYDYLLVFLADLLADTNAGLLGEHNVKEDEVGSELTG